MNTEWFKEWFESAEYLNLYKHRDDKDARSLVKLILNHINISESKTLLDVAFGAGRHSLLFADAGFDVTAFDISKNLLRIAQRKSCENENKIKFFCADVRKLGLRKRYHLITNLFTSFGYFESDKENFLVLNDAREHLVKGGYFVFDYFNVCYLQKYLVPESIETFDGKIFIQRRHFNSNRVIKDIYIQDNNNIKHFIESVRLYNHSEILSEIEKIGFKINSVFGDYNGNSFNENSSPRIIIIAKK